MTSRLILSFFWHWVWSVVLVKNLTLSLSV